MEFITERLLKSGFVSAEDFAFFRIKHSVQDAAAEITQFYKVFHSARWVGEQFVIRLNRCLAAKAITDLNKRFSDIVRAGEIVQGGALAGRRNELESRRLPRLIFRPIRSRFGRFRQLIDAINSCETI
jgi:hypothetical protein